MKKEKPSITIKPVAWNNRTGKTLKYQAKASMAGVSILADPQPTLQKAIEQLFQTAVKYVKLNAALASEAKNPKFYDNIFKLCDEYKQTT